MNRRKKTGGPTAHRIGGNFGEIPGKGLGRKPRAQRLSDDDEPKEAYGFLLALRVVTAAAISKNVTPAMLRVFCILAEYSSGEPGEDLTCAVGEHAISARLGVTRQAVNRQIVALENVGLIERHEDTGRTTKYTINAADEFRDLKTGRAGWHRVEERREQNKALRRAARGSKS